MRRCGISIDILRVRADKFGFPVAMSASVSGVSSISGGTPSKDFTADQRLIMGLIYCVVLSMFGSLMVYSNVERFMHKFVKAGLYGIDLNKPTTKRDSNGQLVRPIQGIKVPEAMGVVSGASYVVVTCAFLPFTTFTPATNVCFLELLAGMMCITCMNFLGFADNVLDLRWRDKLLLPMFAMAPILLVYYIHSNETTMLLPFNLGSIWLGPAFYIFLAVIVIFCTNAINIYAGVNGLEAGQSVVIALSIVVLNVIQLCRLPEGWILREQHLMSLYIMLPFLGVTCPLLYFNWFPARVFVGDTFCYFAGMSFAVAAILGHFCKTLLLLMVPQWFNFLYSLPQLFHVLPCPRHRMPGFCVDKKLLINSWACFPDDFPEGRCTSQLQKKLGLAILRLLYCTGAAQVEYSDDGRVRFTNLTLINLALTCTGPIREDRLTMLLMLAQAICALVCYFIRFRVAHIFYDVVF